jgi:hypothetical protein
MDMGWMCDVQELLQMRNDLSSANSGDDDEYCDVYFDQIDFL